MKTEFCFILFIQLCVIINGIKLNIPWGWTQNSESWVKRCGRHEIFSQCGAPCPETCEFLNIACRAKCRPGGGCVCEDGYVRNEKNNCVRAKRHCKHIFNCGRHEVFSSCAPFCEEQCNIKMKCREGCEPKCVCREGYIRNREFECVRKSKCPPPPFGGHGEWNSGEIHQSHETEECEDDCFGEHKVFSNCGTPPECTPTCDNPEVDIDLCATAGCAKGCFCEKGYVLDNFGDCVAVEECPETNPEACTNRRNEIYLSCGQPPECVPTCDDPKLNIACDAVCVKGCYCKEGYLRNSAGICVRSRYCSAPNNTCPGINEVYFTCGTPPACTPTCDDRKIDVTCLAECNKGCYCKDGYLRNSFGVCVREENCPVNTCSGEHEIFLTCGTPLACTPTCNDRKIGVLCGPQCRKGCYCKSGYLRNSFGACVRDNECHINTCLGANEAYRKCGTEEACIPTCDDRKTNVTCKKRCRKGCYCLDGYIRDDSGICILEEDCPQSNNTCPGEHKVFTTCGKPAACVPTCENPVNNRVCAQVCVEGCVCEEGYLINANGDCISKENCVQPNTTCGANQIFRTCGKLPSCLPTCENPNNTQVICPEICVRGCYCSPGYLMNKDGQCINSDECPPDGNSTTCDDPLKEYNRCGKPAECTATCENPLNNVICPEGVCVKGCFCKGGYLLNLDGVCIPSGECPPDGNGTTCDDPLKEYNRCGKPAECTATCENPLNNVICPEGVCVKGCFCKAGYLLNLDGVCILSGECPPDGNSTTCDDPLKEYNSCGKPSECTATCENPLNNVICPEGVCVKGCFCKAGYLLNLDGVCIPSGECPPGGNSTTCDDPLKEYNSCGKPEECTATCENPLNNVICPEGVCVNGCFCKAGYLLNLDGVCIPSGECPPGGNSTTCDDPLKEYNSCGKPEECTATCENPLNNVICPEGVCVKGCFCKAGYLLNLDGVCILSGECPPDGNSTTCDDPLKEYNSCGKPSECTATCENPLNNVICPEGVCVKGCFCKAGYLLNLDGVCIPSGECPPGGNSTTCDDPLKEYNSCGKPVECTATCENPLNNVICPEGVCLAGCFCKAGYLLNKDGVCIRSGECPPGGNSTTCDDPLKEYNSCGKPEECTATCENPLNNVICPEGVCVKGCFCKAGYLLNLDGVCILSGECPPDGNSTTCDDPLKEYNSCGKPSECTATCENPLNNVICPEGVCVKGCFCKAGYLLNLDGVCIPSGECPPGGNSTTCDDPLKEYNSCGKPVECTATCENPLNNVICPEGVCVKGCFCKAGYLLNLDGVCILSGECPPDGNSTTCDDPLKEYNSCGKPEECTATCENPLNNVICPDGVCVKGCFCKAGYLLNLDGVCILSGECPPDGNSTTCDDPLKEYNSCGKPVECTATCENPLNNVICPEGVCVKGCFCKAGYLLNLDGVCIPSGECPPGGNSTTCDDPLKEYNSCGKPEECTATCENPLNNVICPEGVCVKGCFCKAGYLLNLDGVCILSGECPPDGNSTTCDDPLKEYNSCGKPAECTATCENPLNNVICPEGVCVKGCFCKAGYLLNLDGVCILSGECPPDGNSTTCVDPLKEYNSCGKPEECTATCENPLNNVICPEGVCVNGCFCKAGYLLNLDGVCIPSGECPPGGNSTTCDDPLKEYNSCGKPVECTATCENPLNNVICAEGVCVKGCFCRAGYLLNIYGRCVIASECPPKDDPTKCVGLHKLFSQCGLADICLPTCENPHNTRPCPERCTAGCFCEVGYLVNKNGDCIPENQCPPQKRCRGNHQYYDSCGKPSGYYATCENPLNEKDCPEGCVEGCYCEEGYLINSRGDCIEADKCRVPSNSF